MPQAEIKPSLARPTTLQPQNGHTYDNVELEDQGKTRNSSSLTVLSPFDEQEEWAKISEIMESFGGGINKESKFMSEMEKEFETRLGKLMVYVILFS